MNGNRRKTAIAQEVRSWVSFQSRDHIYMPFCRDIHYPYGILCTYEITSILDVHPPQYHMPLIRMAVPTILVSTIS